MASTFAPFDGWKAIDEVDDAPSVVVAEPDGAADAVPAGVVLLPTGYGAGAADWVLGAAVVDIVVAGVVATPDEDALVADPVPVADERLVLPLAIPPLHSTVSRYTWGALGADIGVVQVGEVAADARVKDGAATDGKGVVVVDAETGLVDGRLQLVHRVELELVVDDDLTLAAHLVDENTTLEGDDGSLAAHSLALGSISEWTSLRKT